MQYPITIHIDLPDNLYTVDDRLYLEEIYDPRWGWEVTGCAPRGIDNYDVERRATAILEEQGLRQDEHFQTDSEYSQIFIYAPTKELANRVSAALYLATAQEVGNKYSTDPIVMF